MLYKCMQIIVTAWLFFLSVWTLVLALWFLQNVYKPLIWCLNGLSLDSKAVKMENKIQKSISYNSDFQNSSIVQNGWAYPFAISIYLLILQLLRYISVPIMLVTTALKILRYM